MNYTKPSSYPEREISISPGDVFNIKINVDGMMDYANHRFCEVSGYEEYELIGETLEILKHPDMPMIFFEVLYERLQNKEPMRLYAKFLSKDKRFFWVMLDFETKINESGEIVAHYAKGRVAPRYGVYKMETLNKILTKIEMKTHGTEGSKRYLIGFLEERKMTYNKFIDEISQYTQDELYMARQEEEKISTSKSIPVTPSPTAVSPDMFDMRINDRIKSENKKPTIPPTMPRMHSPKKKKTLMKKLFGK